MRLAVTPPRVRASLLVLALAATVALSACNPGRPPAATVEGTDISVDHVDALIDAYLEADPELYEEQLLGAGEGTTRLEASTRVLDRYVYEVAVASIAEDRGVVPTDEDRTEAESQLRNSLVREPEVVSGGEDPESQQQAAEETEALRDAVIEALDPETLDWLVELGALRVALSRELVDDGGADIEALAREQYEANLAAYSTRCLRAIQVLDSDVEEVQARLEAGEDFGTVSAELSTPESGLVERQGEIGCLSDSDIAQGFVPTVSEAVLALPDGGLIGPEPLVDQTGAPFDPPQTYFIEVAPPEAAPFEEVRDQIVGQLPAAGDLALDQVLRDAQGDLDVSVNPRFGRWDVETASVITPTEAAALDAEG